MTVVQTIFAFLALSASAYFGLKLRFGGGSLLLCLLWAATIVACAVSFAGVR